MSVLSSLERLSRAFDGVARAITQRRRLAQALFLADPEVRAFAERVCERRGETAFRNVVWHAWHRDELGKRTYWMAHARTVLEFHPWLFACSAPPARARDPEPVPEVALAPGFGPRAAHADDIVIRKSTGKRGMVTEVNPMRGGEVPWLVVRGSRGEVLSDWADFFVHEDGAAVDPVLTWIVEVCRRGEGDGPRCGCEVRAVFAMVRPDGRTAEVRCMTCGLLAP